MLMAVEKNCLNSLDIDEIIDDVKQNSDLLKKELSY